MKHNWVPYAAIAAGTILLVKAVIVISSDDEVLTDVTAWMYLAGLLLAVAAAVGYALNRERRRALIGVGLVLAIVAWVIGVGDLLTPVFEIFSDSDYLGDEGPIGLLGVVLLALGARGKLAGRDPLPA
jgi:drug/metabolite transporter (DMT)-like permease